MYYYWLKIIASIWRASGWGLVQIGSRGICFGLAHFTASLFASLATVPSHEPRTRILTSVSTSTANVACFAPLFLSGNSSASYRSALCNPYWFIWDWLVAWKDCELWWLTIDFLAAISYTFSPRWWSLFWRVARHLDEPWVKYPINRPLVCSCGARSAV